MACVNCECKKDAEPTETTPYVDPEFRKLQSVVDRIAEQVDRLEIGLRATQAFIKDEFKEKLPVGLGYWYENKINKEEQERKINEMINVLQQFYGYTVTKNVDKNV